MFNNKLFSISCLWHVGVGMILMLIWTSGEKTIYIKLCSGLIVGFTLFIDFFYCLSNKQGNQKAGMISLDIYAKEIKTGYGVFKYMDRNHWGAAPTRSKMDDLIPTQPLKYTIISHSADEGTFSTIAKCSEVLRSMQQSAFAKGWCDIPFNYLVSEDGIIYEGRGSAYVSATCKGWNFHSICIGFIGTYLEEKPSPEAFSALHIFLNYLVDKGVLRPDFKLYCLGQLRANKFGRLLDSALYRQIQQMRSGNHHAWKWEEYEPQA